jgi:hypothetical protein
MIEIGFAFAIRMYGSLGTEGIKPHNADAIHHAFQDLPATRHHGRDLHATSRQLPPQEARRATKAALDAVAKEFNTRKTYVQSEVPAIE